MEHGEPLRRPPIEGRFREPIDLDDEPRGALPPPSRFRGGRWAANASGGGGRRQTPGRLAWKWAAVVAALAVLLLVVEMGRRWVVSYVHSLDAYQLTQADIELDPPPPPWFREGASRFLAEALDTQGAPGAFSSLDLDRGQLALSLRRYPWVEKVLGVEIAYPNRVVARLEYRGPVALARLDDGRRLMIDRQGVLLPTEDVEIEPLGLIGIAKFPAPVSPRFGEAWSEEGSAPNLRVRSAAALAGFIHARRAELDSALPATHFVYVQPTGEDGLTIQITGGRSSSEGDSLMFLWEKGPDMDPSRAVPPDQRWAMLLDWVRGHPPGRSGKAIHLILTPRGVEPAPSPLAKGPPPGVSRGPSAVR